MSRKGSFTDWERIRIQKVVGTINPRTWTVTPEVLDRITTTLPWTLERKRDVKEHLESRITYMRSQVKDLDDLPESFDFWRIMSQAIKEAKSKTKKVQIQEVAPQSPPKTLPSDSMEEEEPMQGQGDSHVAGHKRTREDDNVPTQTTSSPAKKKRFVPDTDEDSEDLSVPTLHQRRRKRSYSPPLTPPSPIIDHEPLLPGPINGIVREYVSKFTQFEKDRVLKYLQVKLKEFITHILDAETVDSMADDMGYRTQAVLDFLRNESKSIQVTCEYKIE